jgi:hypothetical protein
MHYLIDTHIALWTITNHQEISPKRAGWGGNLCFFEKSRYNQRLFDPLGGR